MSHCDFDQLKARRFKYAREYIAGMNKREVERQTAMLSDDDTEVSRRELLAYEKEKNRTSKDYWPTGKKKRLLAEAEGVSEEYLSFQSDWYGREPLRDHSLDVPLDMRILNLISEKGKISIVFRGWALSDGLYNIPLDEAENLCVNNGCGYCTISNLQHFFDYDYENRDSCGFPSYKDMYKTVPGVKHEISIEEVVCEGDKSERLYSWAEFYDKYSSFIEEINSWA